MVTLSLLVNILFRTTAILITRCCSCPCCCSSSLVISVYFVMSGQFEDMTAEHSTDIQTTSNSTQKISDYTTSKATFFDPAWQIALTVEFYFQYAVIAIGVFGMAANALVLYALIAENAQNTKKRAINLLIINQNLLDFSSCVLVVVIYSIGYRVYLTGTLGYFLCAVFISDGAIYSTLNASVINLTALTIERYLKVVHPFWSKKYLKRWMIHAAMVFAWIGGFVFALSAAFTTSIIVNGKCLSFYVWQSPAATMVYMTLANVLFFFLPLVIFVYCYGRIVIVMRRQMRVMADLGTGASIPRSATDACHGGTQSCTDECFTDSVQETQMEHHQNHDHC